MIIEDVSKLIGDTPLLKIGEDIHKIKNLTIYAKLEYMNPFGSLKDRIAWGMLKDEIDSLKKQGKSVVESSSGNTSKALAVLCAKEGIAFHNYTNRIKEKSVRDILQVLGCKITEFPGVLECRPSNSNDRNDPKYAAAELERANPDKYFYTKQYQNPNNPKAQAESGVEIVKDLPQVDYLFTFLGTGGSSIGAGTVLKNERGTKIIGLVSEEEEYIPGGRSLTEMWETGFFRKDFYDDIRFCTINKAIDGMLVLNRKAGILVGPTAGATYQGLVEFFSGKVLTKPTVAVFIACDRVEPYIDYIKSNRPSLFYNIENKNSVSQISKEDILEHAKECTSISNKSLIVDLRPAMIFKSQSIPNSINLAYQFLKPLIEEEDIFTNFEDVVFVCSNGKISAKVRAYLNKTYGKETLYLGEGFRKYNSENISKP